MRVWEDFSDKAAHKDDAWVYPEDDKWAATSRGWLKEISPDGCQETLGTYVDYGPKHYRSPHEYCRRGKLCRECEPGNVYAVASRKNGGSYVTIKAHYFVTIGEARCWLDEEADEQARKGLS